MQSRFSAPHSNLKIDAPDMETRRRTRHGDAPDTETRRRGDAPDTETRRNVFSYMVVKIFHRDCLLSSASEPSVSEEPPTGGTPPPTKERNFCQISSLLPFFLPSLLPVACCLLPVACYLLPVTCCLLPVACYLLPVACCLVS
ncbi:MAG: hypothetical protein F6K31_25160 [Symploca sp. SIO2G7]|nr:hypothetical protein [Symploca sp. SIO2G7]